LVRRLPFHRNRYRSQRSHLYRLEDIRNTTAIERCFFGGKAFDREALDAMFSAADRER
jgi:hypothetical protein